jgi:hypothetical protein
MGSEIFMRPEEARIGRRTRVRNDHRKADFRGREGTIAKRWGDPGYPALDVLLDDGRWQLFWFHELEPVDEDEIGARRQNEPRRAVDTRTGLRTPPSWSMP